jgi:hypothetical protein
MMWISVYQRKSAVKVFDFLRVSASPRLRGGYWFLVVAPLRCVSVVGFGCGSAPLW